MIEDQPKQWCIYKHTSPSGKSYIGMTSKTPEKRWLNGKGYNPNTKFGQAIIKYGWDNFSHEILENNIPSLSQAQQREIYYINFFDTFTNGYNSTLGGDNVAPDIIIKHQVICHETQKIFESTVAAAEYYDVAHSQIGRACKTGNKVKGQHFVYLEEYSPDWQPKDGRTNISKMRAVFCVERKEIFPSVREAARQLNITSSLISRCCNGQIDSTHGYHFYFIKKEEENKL